MFLIGHHHTYTNVTGMDYQILIEADFLVNFEEENTDTEAIKKVYKNIFKTKTGKEFCRNIFDISPKLYECQSETVWLLRKFCSSIYTEIFKTVTSYYCIISPINLPSL